MATFFNTLDGKTLAELPKIPTNLTLSGGTGAIKATWTNNNTVGGTVNELQYWNGSAWVSGSTALSGSTSAVVSGLGELTTYKARVAVKKSSTGRYYPTIVKSITTTDNPYPISGLLARWQFEDNLNDSTANGYNLSSNRPSNLTYVTGKVGKCLANNGTTDTATVGTNASALITAITGTNPFSYAGWVYVNTTDTFGFFSQGSSIGQTISSSRLIGVEIGSGSVSMYKRDNSGSVTVSSQVNNNNWYHFVLTFDGTITKLYKNGNATPIASYTNSTSITPQGYLQIGFLRADLINEKFYDQVYFYNRALTTAEVAKLYNSGNGI